MELGPRCMNPTAAAAMGRQIAGQGLDTGPQRVTCRGGNGPAVSLRSNMPAICCGWSSGILQTPGARPQSPGVANPAACDKTGATPAATMAAAKNDKSRFIVDFKVLKECERAFSIFLSQFSSKTT